MACHNCHSNCKPTANAKKWDTYNNYRLLNVYCEIFGPSSYGEGRTSLRVRLRHMNECRIFHNIYSITFLLYSFYIKIFLFQPYYLHKNQNIISVYQPKNCFKFEITLCHLVSSCSFKTRPNGAKIKMTFGIG